MSAASWVYQPARPGVKTDQRGTPVSTILMWVGLFSASWDRLAVVPVGSFSLKLPVIAFACSLVLTLADGLIFKGGGPWRRQPVTAWSLFILLAFLMTGFLASDPLAAFLQWATVLLGAIIPMFAVFLNVRQFGGVEQALTAFLRGGFVAATFGLYQLAAFYLHLPQLIEYRATGGGFGRISAFSYEAGYFGYFMILVIAALLARAAVREEPVSRWHLTFLIGTLLLANSRATAFTLVLLLVLVKWRKPAPGAFGRYIHFYVFGAIGLGMALVLLPNLLASAIKWVSTVFDPTEATSNAPRLRIIDATWGIAQDNFLTGIGGGNLRHFLAEYGGPIGKDVAANEVVANNIWIQALLDGGIILFAVEVVFILVAIFTLYKKALPVARTLLAGWISVLLVSSLVTSYFFDLKLWVVLALAAGYAARSEPGITTITAAKASKLAR
jgi:hypothetical protein